MISAQRNALAGGGPEQGAQEEPSSSNLAQPEIQGDELVVLQCAKNLRLTKTWRADGTIDQYSDAKHFRVHCARVGSIHGLARLLDKLAATPSRALIRGRFVGEAEAIGENGAFLRTLKNFHDQPLHFVMLDIDQFVPSAADPVLEPTAAIEEFIRTKLPACFHERSYYWRLSASAGAPGKEGLLKAHLAFWLAKPYTSGQLKAWKISSGIDVDGALFNEVQLHFVADPVIEAGVVDPVPVRGGLVEDWLERHTVELEISTNVIAMVREHESSGDVEMADPREKHGPIGAFCRAFTIEEILERWAEQLPFEWETPGDTRRLNFNDGSGAPGGAFVSDCREYVVNKHNSDPFNNRAVNKFDLVRHYVFGHLDDADDAFDADPTSSSSYQAAIAALRVLPEVAAELEAERATEAADRKAQALDAAAQWRAEIDTAADAYDIDLLMDRIAADITLSETQRAELAQSIHSRFAAVSESLKSPMTVAKIKARLEPSAAPAQEQQAQPDGIWMLRDLALVCVGSKVAVLRQKATDDPANMQPIVTMAVNDCRTFHLDHTVWRPRPTGEGFELVNMFDVWLSHPETVRYHGIEFAPSGARENYYNLWPGKWGVEPTPGDCSLFLDHIRNVICAGDEGAFSWVISWLADIIQHPAGKPGTALVLRGGEGAGKGKAFADQIRDIVGVRLFRKVSNINHITGRFNQHLAGKLVIFANESVWGGDRSKEGVLKDLITEPVQLIEPKGLDAFEVRDYARLIFATNEDWAVPTGADARRYTVLDVANHRRGDDAYFRALVHQMDQGGREAFLHHLLNVDLSSFNPHQAYKTAALLDLKLRRLEVHDRWLLDRLSSCDHDADPSDGSARGADEWPERWPCKDCYAGYVSYAREQGARHTMVQQQFGKWIKDRIPGIKVVRHGSEPRCYALPLLAECREAFERYIGHPIAWEGAPLHTRME